LLAIVAQRGEVAMRLLTLPLALVQQVPPPTPEESQRAAIAIVLIMLGGLLLTIGLLRWVARSERAKTGGGERGPWEAVEARLAEEDRKAREECPDEESQA